MKFVSWFASIRGRYYWSLLICLVATSAALGLFASREFEAGNWSRGDYLLFCAAVVCAASLVAIPALRDSGQGNLILQIRAKARTDMGDALDIAAEELGNLAKLRSNADGTQRDRAYGRALQLLLAAACETAGPGEGRIRASFFEHRPATADSPEGLYHEASFGREASSFDFLAGEAIGDEAIRMVKHRDYLYEPDTRSAPPIHWTKGKPSIYASFLSVSCAIKRAPIGMLTVDSTAAVDINEDDVPALQMIGRLICVAHRLSK